MPKLLRPHSWMMQIVGKWIQGLLFLCFSGSILVPGFLIMYPKYRHFLLFTSVKSGAVNPAFSNIQSLAFCCCPAFVMTQLSQPYVATGQWLQKAGLGALGSEFSSHYYVVSSTAQNGANLAEHPPVLSANYHFHHCYSVLWPFSR